MSEKIQNPFNCSNEAKRYQSFRPRYHETPFKYLKNFLGGRAKRVLDVACGTGHSTMALAKYFESVIGVDSSEAMLGEAKAQTGISFERACAEELPFKYDSFDLINVSMGFHWLDQRSFLREAQRTLMEDGFLSIDNFGFAGDLNLTSKAHGSHNLFISERLPQVGRGPVFRDIKTMNEFGLKKVDEYKHESTIEMNIEQFMGLLKTWSNFQVLSENEKKSVRKEMKRVYTGIFNGRSLSLPFAGEMQIYNFQR